MEHQISEENFLILTNSVVSSEDEEIQEEKQQDFKRFQNLFRDDSTSATISMDAPKPVVEAPGTFVSSVSYRYSNLIKADTPQTCAELNGPILSNDF